MSRNNPRYKNDLIGIIADAIQSEMIGINPISMAVLDYAKNPSPNLKNKIKNLIDAGTDVNQESILNNATPLFRAAEYGLTDIVEILLDAGAQINQGLVGENETSPIFVAAQQGNIEVVDLLIARGANVNKARRFNGATPIHIASWSGHSNVVKSLIKAGANIHTVRTNDGTTPLFMAVQEGHIQIVKDLLAAGAKTDVNKASTDDGSTPIFSALLIGHYEIAKLLVESGAQLTPEQASRASSLLPQMLSNGGDEKLVKFLTSYGASLDFIDSTGKNLLHFSIEYPHLLKYLIDYGLDINKIGGKDQSTPLFLAAMDGYFESVKLLVEAGAKVDKARIGNNELRYGAATPLFMAAQDGYLDITKFLVENGADVNKATTNDGSTPLYIASARNHLAVVKFLISKQANPNKATTDDGTLPIHHAIHFGHNEVVKVLIEAGTNIDQETFDGSTPLHLAILKNNLKAIEILISGGCNLNKKNKRNKNPLDFACFLGNLEAIKLLINHNVTIDEEAIAIAKKHPNKKVLHLLEEKLLEDKLNLDPTVNLISERIIKFADLIDNTNTKKKGSANKIIKDDLTNATVEINRPNSTFDKDGKLISLGVKIKMPYQKKDKSIKEFTTELKLNLNQEDATLVEVIDLHIVKKLVEELGRGGDFAVINRQLKPQDKIIKREEKTIKKTTRQELNSLQSRIEKKLIDLAISHSKPSENREILQQKIISKLTNSASSETDDNSLSQTIKKFSNRLLETYKLADNTEDKNIEISRILTIYRSILTNEIRSAKMALPNQIQLYKSQNISDKQDKILAQIFKAEKFIDDLSLLIALEQKYVIDELSDELTNVKGDDLERGKSLNKIEKQINHLEQIFKLETAKPKTTLSTKSAGAISESLFLLEEGKKYEIKDLTHTLPNLLEYDPKQIKIIKDNLANLKQTGKPLDDFYTAIIKNLQNSSNFVESARRIAILICNIIPDDKRKNLVHQLREYKNYSKIVGNDINKVAEFFVGLDFIQNKDQDLNLPNEQIELLLANTRVNLENDKIIDQPQLSFTQRVLENSEDKIIKQFLSDLVNQRQFTTILCWTPHGKATSKPYIADRTAQDFIDNLITDKQPLEEKLKSHLPCSEQLLEKITKIITNNIEDGFKKRGDGAHNSCFKVPKIFPHQGSPLSDEESKLYVERFSNLQKQLDEHRIR